MPKPRGRPKKQWPPYAVAHDIVKKAKLSTHDEWEHWSRTTRVAMYADVVPGKPNRVYEGCGWVSWSAWRGADGHRTRVSLVAVVVSEKKITFFSSQTPSTVAVFFSPPSSTITHYAPPQRCRLGDFFLLLTHAQLTILFPPLSPRPNRSPQPRRRERRRRWRRTRSRRRAGAGAGPE